MTLFDQPEPRKSRPQLKWQQAKEDVPIYYIESPINDETDKCVLRIEYDPSRNTSQGKWCIEIMGWRKVYRDASIHHAEEIKVMAESMLASVEGIIDRLFKDGRKTKDLDKVKPSNAYERVPVLCKSIRQFEYFLKHMYRDHGIQVNQYKLISKTMTRRVSDGLHPNDRKLIVLDEVDSETKQYLDHISHQNRVEVIYFDTDSL